MPLRKEKIEVGSFYHVFNKTIEGFVIFNNNFDYHRMLSCLSFYNILDQKYKLSYYFGRGKEDFFDKIKEYEKIVEIYAYCLMPTHVHLLLREIREGGISFFMNKISKSYAQYFNKKYKRQGPLWQGRYKNVLVKEDEQLIYLTRYIYRNPCKSGLVDSPQEWKYSSLQEVLNDKYGVVEPLSSISDMSLPAYIEFLADNPVPVPDGNWVGESNE
ncbi:MAG: transposase [Candidatus Omnitrophica bacterium]|nr:transposase [Candidatus Omnitrophota bacterium]MDD5441750.1 transposase [Candidatus Omnitrophota bacterium]